MKLVFTFAYFFLCFTSYSADITITAHPDYPPISWESGGTLKGASIKLVKTALHNLGHKAVFVPVGTWGRAQLEVKIGRIDILLPPYRTPEREKYYSFPEKPFLMDQTVLITKKGKVIEYKDFKDLKKYNGIAIFSDSFGDSFDKADKKYTLLKRFSRTSQCLKFLLRGRADYLIAGKNAALAVISRLGLQEQLDIQDQVVVETGMYTAISNKSVHNTKAFRKSFFNEMNKLVSQKVREETLKEALREYATEKNERLKD